MAIKHFDRYTTTLSSAYTSGATSLEVTAIPSGAGASDVWYLKILAEGANTEEILKVTAHSGSGPYTLTVVGAQANSSASNHALGATAKGSVLVKAGLDQYSLATAEINAQTGTTYTLVAADNGKIVTLSNASAITLTVPSGLGAGFSCLIVQLGAGAVTPTASSTTINQRDSLTVTAGQYAVASLVAYAADTFVLAGDLA